MRFYPPLFFQRIWVQKVEKGFRSVKVKISKSILNSNYNHSIFGGTIFSAADPFYAVCLYQILNRKGYRIKLWIKFAEIHYLKPGFSSLYFSIHLKDAEIEEICKELDDDYGEAIKLFKLEIVDKQGKLCALVRSQVYIRKLYK